jgi:hypothetical protein
MINEDECDAKRLALRIKHAALIGTHKRYFDFSPGPGWYDAIDELCTKIETYCAEAGRDLPIVGQVKEKFGGLRFYVSSADDTIYEFISEAERTCDCTCENCGAPGTLRQSGWWKVLCDPCDAKR